jgi:hypothetical protein
MPKRKGGAARGRVFSGSGAQLQDAADGIGTTIRSTSKDSSGRTRRTDDGP